MQGCWSTALNIKEKLNQFLQENIKQYSLLTTVKALGSTNLTCFTLNMISSLTVQSWHPNVCESQLTEYAKRCYLLPMGYLIFKAFYNVISFSSSFFDFYSYKVVSSSDMKILKNEAQSSDHFASIMVVVLKLQEFTSCKYWVAKCLHFVMSHMKLNK